MSRRLAMAVAAVLALGAVAPAAAGVGGGSKGGVSGAQASINGNTATLSTALVSRSWRLPAVGGTGVATTSFVDRRTGRQWSAPASNDITIDLGGVTLDGSTLAVESVVASKAAGDPRIPGAAPGARLTFTYAPVIAGSGIHLVRSYTAYAGSAVIEVDSTVVNDSPVPLRVSSFSLDELTSRAPVTAEVQRYVGGSDWRDDFRQVTNEPPGKFDAEGEVVRLDDGTGSGWFHVSERRGGVMSRAARNAAGGVSIGVDYQRDLFDWGPLMSSPPNYNRQDNPTYPVGGRERTVAPLSSMSLGRAYTGVYHGGAQEAARAFVQSFTAHDMPAYPRTVGLNSFHPWAHGPGLNDAQMRAEVVAGEGVGLESLMLDDQWQGSSSGDWHFDAARFPDSLGNGTPDFVRYIQGTNTRFALWMSPVEFNNSSQTAKAHPDWVCTPTGQVTRQVPDDAGLGVWDVTNTAFQAYLGTVIDRAVSAWGVREFKFDFQSWVDCGAHDYLDYEDAFVAMVRGFEKRHPTVTFELDETNDQRAWPFESAAIGPSWFDNGHTGSGHTPGMTYVSKELHDLWTAAPWLPPSSIGFGLYDGYLQPPYTARYLMPMALLSHLTFWTDLTKLSEADRAETAWWTTWFEAHRNSIPRFTYEDSTGDPSDGKSILALQPWAGDAGYLFAFRQAGGAAVQSVPLKGIAATHRYRVTDVRSGQVLGVFSGRALAAGLSVSLPADYTSAVLSISPLR